MVVRLVTQGHALFLELLQPLPVDLDTTGARLGNGVIPDHPVVVSLVSEFFWLIVLTEILLLEGELIQPQALCLTDDGVFDLRELFLL